MTTLKVNISSELEKKFREIAMKKYGYARGALSTAAQKALANWTLKNEKIENAKEVVKKHIKNPVDELEGMLAHVKGKTSEQLQNEALDIWAEEALHYKKHRK
jgi:hypothetical protein